MDHRGSVGSPPRPDPALRPVRGTRAADGTSLDPPSAPSYAGLTPDTVLDALESVGLRGDARLLALNSYENRVYQV